MRHRLQEFYLSVKVASGGNMVSDFLINIAASAAFFILGVSSTFLYKLYKLRHLKDLWRVFLKDKSINVILSTRPGPHARSTPRVSLNEMQGFVILSQLLGRLNVAVKPVDSMVRLSELADSDLIVLGGPSANNIAAEIWHRISDRIPFALDIPLQAIRVGSRCYEPIIDQGGHITKDFAIIIRGPQPLNPQKQMFLFLGCHGYGTLGAVRIVTDTILGKELAKNCKNSKAFAAIAQFDLQNQSIVSCEIVESYIIPHL
jgi:hypothetical protein